MANTDTTELLKECNSGSKMAVDSIDEILPKVDSSKLKKILNENKTRHEALGNKLHSMLSQAGEREEDPPAMAKAMSKMTIGMKMMMTPTDGEVASIMTDGCNMGIKSVSEYLNKYESADNESRALAAELVDIEQELADSLRPFL